MHDGRQPGHRLCGRAGPTLRSAAEPNQSLGHRAHLFARHAHREGGDKGRAGLDRIHRSRAIGKEHKFHRAAGTQIPQGAQMGEGRRTPLGPHRLAGRDVLKFDLPIPRSLPQCRFGKSQGLNVPPERTQGLRTKERKLDPQRNVGVCGESTVHHIQHGHRRLAGLAERLSPTQEPRGRRGRAERRLT